MVSLTQPLAKVTHVARRKWSWCEHPRLDRMGGFLVDAPETVVERLRGTLPNSTEIRFVAKNSNVYLAMLSWPQGLMPKNAADIDVDGWVWNSIYTSEEMMTCCDCPSHNPNGTVHVERFDQPRPKHEPVNLKLEETDYVEEEKCEVLSYSNSDDFQPMMKNATEWPGHVEMLARVLDGVAPLTTNSLAAFQPFSAAFIWPSLQPRDVSKELQSERNHEWIPMSATNTLIAPLLCDVPIMNPLVVLYLDKPENHCLLYHSIASGSSPDNAALLPVFRSEMKSRHRNGVEHTPSTAPWQFPKRQRLDVEIPKKLALTLRVRATLFRARFKVADADVKSPRVVNLWKAFLVNEQWVINYVAEKYIDDVAVDRPLLGAIRNICALLKLEYSFSSGSGISAKLLERYPRTKQDVERLGLHTRARHITTDTINRAIYYALRSWTGSTVVVRNGHRAKLIDVDNTWF